MTNSHAAIIVKAAQAATIQADRTRRFDEADRVPLEEAPHRAAAAGDPSLAHCLQRQIRLVGNQHQQKVRVCLQGRDAASARHGTCRNRIAPIHLVGELGAYTSRNPAVRAEPQYRLRNFLLCVAAATATISERWYFMARSQIRPRIGVRCGPRFWHYPACQGGPLRKPPCFTDDALTDQQVEAIRYPEPPAR